MLGVSFFSKNVVKNKSPEISLLSYSNKGKNFGKIVAASCGFSNQGHGSADERTYCSNINCNGTNVVAAGWSTCGGACVPDNPAVCNPYLCTVQPAQTQNISCPDGQNGNIIQERTSSCPSGAASPVWSGWSTTSNSCQINCAPELPQSRTISCPAGQFGSNTQERTSSCSSVSATPAWSAWTDINNTCYTPDFCAAGITPTVNYLSYNSIISGIYYYLNNTAPTPNYTLGSCPGGIPGGYKRICNVSRNSSDGTNSGSWQENYASEHTSWAIGQASKPYPYNETLSVSCGYYDFYNNLQGSLSNTVSASANVLHPNYGQSCTTTNDCEQLSNGTIDKDGICTAVPIAVTSCTNTNICGQTFSGLACPTGCTASNGTPNINSTCLTSLTPQIDTINPNGSVDFKWTIGGLGAGYSSKCGFVDLTYGGAGKLIPGLQNLDISVNRARITNIQNTTRFCLVCKFYNQLNVDQGESVLHQWVRVQRIGEN